MRFNVPTNEQERPISMNTWIEAIESAAQESAAAHIRHEVFGREWNCKVEAPTSGHPGKALHLLASIGPHGEPAATLSVVDTTGDTGLHERFGLPFDGSTRAARYTQLAVLKPYRGLNIPLALIVEARRRLVSPGRFEYTWLLFHSERAKSSSLCRLLAFNASDQTFRTEYGRMRVLVKNERSAEAVATGLGAGDHNHSVYPQCALWYPASAEYTGGWTAQAVKAVEANAA